MLNILQRSGHLSILYRNVYRIHHGTIVDRSTSSYEHRLSRHLSRVLIEYVGSGTFGIVYKVAFVDPLAPDQGWMEFAFKVIPFSAHAEYPEIEDPRRPEWVEARTLLSLNRLINRNTPHLVVNMGHVMGHGIPRIRHESDHLIKYLQSRLSSSTSILDCSITLFCQWINGGNMIDYIMPRISRLNSAIFWRVLFFQAIYTLHVLQVKYDGFRHNDLSGKNVLFQVTKTEDPAPISSEGGGEGEGEGEAVPPTTTKSRTVEVRPRTTEPIVHSMSAEVRPTSVYTKSKVNLVLTRIAHCKRVSSEFIYYKVQTPPPEIVFNVPDLGFQLKLWDFDYCNSVAFENIKIHLHFCSQYGIGPTPNRYYDLHYFLNSTYRLLRLKDQPLDPDTSKFLDEVLPERLRGNCNSERSVMYYRYLGKEEVTTPLEILRNHPYFEPFRVRGVKDDLISFII